MKRFEVCFKDYTNGAESTIDNINAPGSYTAEEYTKDYIHNADLGDLLVKMIEDGDGEFFLYGHSLVDVWIRDRNDEDISDNWSPLYADEDLLDDTKENIMKNLDNVVGTAEGVTNSYKNDDGTYHIVFDHGHAGDFFVELTDA